MLSPKPPFLRCSSALTAAPVLAVGKPATNIGKSLKDKNDYIKNQLLNQSSALSPLSLPLGLPVKAITNIIVNTKVIGFI